jgi:hypothetical protein
MTEIIENIAVISAITSSVSAASLTFFGLWENKTLRRFSFGTGYFAIVGLFLMLLMA